MRRTTFILALLIGLVGSAGAACSVSFDGDTEEAGAFQCETDDDCLGANQECQQNEDGTLVCDDTSTCIDRDKDGYGSPENNGDLADCDACQNGRPGGCDKVDCDDEKGSGENINPGQRERCDGIDNNCDGEVDNIGFQACEDTGDCPLDNEPIVTPPQEKTGWDCKSVDGQQQCVLTGDFTDGSCTNDSPEYWGICGEENEAEWSKVPQECTELSN